MTLPDERPVFSALVNRLSEDLSAIAEYLELSASLVNCGEEHSTTECDYHKELNERPCGQDLTAAVDTNSGAAILGT